MILQNQIDYMTPIWKEILNLENIDAEDNFFHIGGHSLLAVELCQRIQDDLGYKFTLKDLMENPTLKQFSLLLNIKDGTEKKDTDKNTFDLTINQKQMWFLEQLHPDTSMHNLPSAIIVKIKIDPERLTKAYLKFIKNHPCLRTTIYSGTKQKIMDMDLVEKKFRIVTRSLSKEKAINEMHQLGAAPMSLSRIPNVEVILYHTFEGESIIFSRFHHIFWDGWCFGILFDELSAYYSDIDSIPKREPMTYFDFNCWQKKYIESTKYQNDLLFWEKKLSKNLPPLNMPVDYPRPAQRSHEAGIVLFNINQNVLKSLDKFCQKLNITLFNLLLGAFQKTLLDYSQTNEVIVGIPIRGRGSSDLFKTVGNFVNTLPVYSENINSIKKYFMHVQNEVFDALEYQDVPLSNIIHSLKNIRDNALTPIFQSTFSYQDVSNQKTLFAGEPISQIVVQKASSHTDIDMWAKFNGLCVTGALEYRKDLFKQSTIERFKDYFFDILNFLAYSSATSWSEFTSASVLRQFKIINNRFPVDIPYKTIAEYVDAHAQKNPDKIAVFSHKENLSYQQLKQKSDAIANYLIGIGVKPSDLVGLSVSRDHMMLICLIGIMKSAAGYVPLDPFYPDKRLDYMIKHSQLKYLICNQKFKNKFKKHSIKLITIEDINLENCDLTINLPSIDIEQALYVIYTSGSTGDPKGVEVTYRSVLNFLHSMKKKPGMSTHSTLLAVTTLSFDIAVLELYLPLVVGGSLVIATKDQVIDGDALISLITKYKIDIMQATPATWKLLLKANWQGSKQFKLLCGGEPFTKSLASKLIKRVSEIWNMYGPTETTVWSTIKQIEKIDEPITIGRPIDNTSVYVLNKAKKLAPLGAIGELYIAGEGLALGYKFRKDLTNMSFVSDSISGRGLMYKTGDLVRVLESGELECLGRNDTQVKVRGHRIELGEIETTLLKHQNIEEAIVLTQKERTDDVRLVAYIKLVDKDQFASHIIRNYLKNKLPTYMIPSNFIVLGSIPLTPNGKIDKTKLPVFEAKSEAVYKEVSVEEKFTKIWMEVLGINFCNKSDNFFDIGGHSLLAVDLFSLINKTFKINMSLTILLSSQTFGSILAEIKNELYSSEKNFEQASSNFAIPNICSSLVGIKNTGSKKPIFCFHGVGGNVLNYRSLIDACGEHPLIGVQSQGVDGKGFPLHSIEDMVDKYINEIKFVQTAGPYILAGASMGGIIAIEAAIQLQKLGENIAGIILMDSFGPELDIKKSISKSQLLIHKWFSLRWRVRNIWIRLQSATYHVTGKTIPHEIRYFNIESLNYKALWSHKVNEYQGDVHIIRAPITQNNWYRDPYLGWGKVIKGMIKTYVVDGQHESFVESKKLPEVFKNVLCSF